MLKKQHPSGLSKKMLKKLHGLLCQRSIHAFWRAGRLLDRKLEPANFEKMLNVLSERLRRLGGDGPFSAVQLRKCRHLADWDLEDVKAAKARQVPWRVVVSMLFLDRLALRVPETRRAALIARRKALVRAYPKKTKDRKSNRKSFDAWGARLAEAKQAGVRSLLPGPKRSGTHARLLSEAGDAVLHRLRNAVARMKAVHSLLTPAARAKSKTLEVQVTALTRGVELLYGRRKSKRPQAPV